MKERREENLNISDCRNGGNKMKQGEKRGTKKGRQKKREDEILLPPLAKIFHESPGRKCEWSIQNVILTERERDKGMERRKEERKTEKTRPDTRPIPVADGWAGAEMHVFPTFRLVFTDRPTDRPTDRRTDGQSLL